MEFVKDSLKNVQAYADFKLVQRGFDQESLQERLLLLTEEVGELVKACRKLHGTKVDANKNYKHDIEGELSDVLNMLLAVSTELKIDLESAFLKKQEEIDKRIYS